MTKNTNSKQRYDVEYAHYFVSVIEILNLFGIWCLCIGFCLKFNFGIRAASPAVPS